MDQAFWDARYGEQRIWSGDPNGALIDEAGDLAPGHALDLGCGEGDDARWLAARGWTVIAVDISRVAVARAQSLGSGADDAIEWVCVDVVADGVPAGPFDLVSMQYFPLLRTPDDAPMRTILDAVAPGGALLVVSHDLTHMLDHHADGAARDWDGPDPADMYQPDDVARLLADGHNGGWDVVAHERRARRHSGAGGGAHHVTDVVLHAVRRG